MQCDPNVVIVFAQMAIPVVLGAVGFYYTRAQVNVARNKLRLDHYDKRFAVFDAARTFLGHAFTISEVTIGQQNEFLAATSSAQFIFDDPKVSKYLDDLLNRVLELPFKREDLHAATNDAERKTAAEKYTEERRWLREQYSAMQEVFRPHLLLRA